MEIEKRRLPKQAFDSEYMTEFLREVRFLTERGIKYTFVKKTQDYGVSQYKYKKTPALFAALVEFYATIEAERNVRRRMYQQNKEIVLSPEQVQKAQEILERAVLLNAPTENKAEDDTI